MKRADLASSPGSLEPITNRCLTRPSYGHRELLGVDRGTWIELNREALRVWWTVCGDPAGLANDALVGAADFAYFCICQYDAECANREELKREWATLPRERRRD